MQFHYLATLAAALIIGTSSSALAEPQGDGNKLIPTDLYISPRSEGMSIPSGNINIVPGIEDETTAVSKEPAAIPDDTTNMLGCAGVGQGEYTSGVYNMPESFGKFQQDVDSLLSRQLLTMNYAMPQTAALFDQLNNYGNQRYASFQQGCNVSALKQDAKNQYLNACVAKITPQRKQLIPSTYKEPLLSSMAYAQAWEICSNQYVSDTVAIGLRNEMNESFAKQVRAVENVTEAIKPLLCNAKSESGGAGNESGSNADNACWQTLLIPQVRLCLDDTLGCDDEAGYSMNEPLLTMPRLFDTMRFIMDDIVVSRRVTDFNLQLEKGNVDNATLEAAATEAVMLLSNATLGRAGESGGVEGAGTPFFGKAADVKPDPYVREFQLSYMNCKDPDIMTPLKEYEKKILKEIEKAKGQAEVELKKLEFADYKPVIDELQLKDADEDQLTALRQVVRTSLGCTANQSVPIFDPLITASLKTQCTDSDRYAFYSMAGYDVAMSATRDIYRYLNLRLKQTYAQLMTQSMVPNPSSTTAGAGTSTSPTLSPELNSRLARVVKEVMIPQVEGQISRLEELNKTRGQFAQRVQQIYRNKAGCVYNTSGRGAK